jgi:cytochrome b
MPSCPEDSVRVKVWNPLLRVAHWGLATAVTVALASDENRAVHEVAGYAAFGIVALRIVWGFVGPTHARFLDFVRPPGEILAYLKSLIRRSPRRYMGHNPAGGAMIVALLALVITTAVSGWMSETDRFFGVGWVEGLHAASANLLMFLLVAHIAGVVASSVIHRENLVRAMITGSKPAVVTGIQSQRGS